jgi:putative phosphoribosyl transferase
MLASEQGPDLVVVGLARGGVVTAAEVASALAAPLDVICVRKVAHPWQPEYGVGAVTPGGGGYLHALGELPAEMVARIVEAARDQAALLDERLHTAVPPLEPTDRRVLLVDDGLATGATMIAAVRWARAAGATHVVVAVPVAPVESLEQLHREADAVFCPHPLLFFFAVGEYYAAFPPVGDGEVIELLSANRREPGIDAEEPQPAGRAALAPVPSTRT